MRQIEPLEQLEHLEQLEPLEPLEQLDQLEPLARPRPRAVWLAVLRVLFLASLVGPTCSAAFAASLDLPPGVSAAAFAEETTIFSENFESTPCGLLPRKVSSAANGVTTRELCRYVTNVDAYEGERSLAYDFSHLSAGSRGAPAPAHGWLSWWGNDRMTNGWVVYRVALKRVAGALSGEIRARYHFKPGDKPHWWISQWITVNDEYWVRVESTHRSISLGKVPQGRWVEVEMWLPTPGNQQKSMWGRLVYDRGKRPGPWVELNLNGMIMDSGYNLMQYGGAGKSKWYLDAIRVTRRTCD